MFITLYNIFLFYFTIDPEFDQWYT